MKVSAKILLITSALMAFAGNSYADDLDSTDDPTLEDDTTAALDPIEEDAIIRENQIPTYVPPSGVWIPPSGTTFNSSFTTPNNQYVCANGDNPGYMCGDFSNDYAAEINDWGNNYGITATPIVIDSTSDIKPGHAVVLVTSTVYAEHEFDLPPQQYNIYDLVEPQNGNIISAWEGTGSSIPFAAMDPICDQFNFNCYTTVAFTVDNVSPGGGYTPDPDNQIFPQSPTVNPVNMSSGEQPAPDACDNGSDADPMTGTCG